MADEAPPPKPKLGSLRDRIAAFEKPSASSAPGPPPPRPKPGGLGTWKPKQPSPPSSPRSNDAPEKDRRIGGMSASDAKESIGQGGSLKERMAALRGQGAFGGAGVAPGPPPKPAGDRPKWKPPPRVTSPASDEALAGSESVKSPPLQASAAKSPSSEEPPLIQAPGSGGSPVPEASGEAEIEGGEEPAEADPEEEERQRRAAIAARMARLGGARVGMAPPVFGKKPPVKKETPKEDDTKSVQSGPIEPPAQSSPVATPEINTSNRDEPSYTTPDYFAGADAASFRKDSATSLLSADSTTTQPSRSPASMPVPAVPRRAGPPRKKAGKSPSPSPAPPPIVAEEVTESPAPAAEQETSESAEGAKEGALAETAIPSPDQQEKIGDRQEEIGQVDDSADPDEDLSLPGNVTSADKSPEEATTEVAPAVEQPVEQESKNELSESGAPIDNESVPADEVPAVQEPPVSVLPDAPSAPAPGIPLEDEIEEYHEEPESIHQPEQPNEEDEATRRKRVAERLAKMGGFNPFGAPPAPPSTSTSPPPETSRKASIASVASVTAPAPQEPSRRTSVRKSSHDSTTPALRKSSIDSVSSGHPPPVRRDSRPIVSPPPLTPEATPQPVEDPLESAKPEVDPPSHEQHFEQNDLSPQDSPPQHETQECNEREAESSDLDEHATPLDASDSLPPPPIPSATRPAFAPADEDDSDDAIEPPPPPPISARRSMPPPPRAVPAPPADFLEIEPEHNEEVEEEPPAPPPRRALPTRRPTADSVDVPTSPAAVPPPPRPTPAVQTQLPSSSSSASKGDGEILDEDEGDPIDPGFHSPRNTLSGISLPPISSVPVRDPEAETEPQSEVPAQDEDEEDEEQARRRTIAERMAKLGGIKFGAAPVGMGRPPAKPSHANDEPAATPPSGEEPPAGEELTEEEEEKARKARIAAKIANMGGMRFGMLPPGMSSGEHTQQEGRFRREASEDTVVSPPPPPARAAPTRPPPPPQAQDTDSEYDHLSASEEGVKVEAEESEAEVVDHEEAEEEAPPPPPSRAGRRTSSSAHPVSQPSAPPTPKSAMPHIPGGRPPVPVVPTNVGRRSSVQTRKSSADSVKVPQSAPATKQVPSEYVMVEEPEEIPPPPPPRSARLPTRKPTVDQTEGASPAWERSSSPTTNIDFGETADLSLSWSEDSTSYPTEASSAPPLAPHAAPPPSQAPASVSGKPPAEVQLSSEDLIAVWGKVGVLIHEAAASLLEKSKKMLVGDGTYIGFVNATLSQIPNAQIVAPPSYGYLVYSQVAASVQKRISDIMPGDVVVLSDAKFKGHKGLQSYAQSAGVGEPLIGIVSEYDTKKSKVKVFQANQHVGQQTVESVSYRLEDLKNGSVKVFRVLEA